MPASTAMTPRRLGLPADCLVSAELTSTIAARHRSAPVYSIALSRSPPARAKVSGRTVDMSAETGATTLIGPAASPA